MEWTLQSGKGVFLEFGKVNLEQSSAAETKFINVASPWISDMTMIIILITTACAMHCLVCFIAKFCRRKRSTSRHRKLMSSNDEHSCLEIVTVDPREPCSDVKSKDNCIPSDTNAGATIDKDFAKKRVEVDTRDYTNEELAAIDKDFTKKRVEVDPTLDVQSENCNTRIFMLWKNNAIIFGNFRISESHDRIIGATNNIINSENNKLALCIHNGGVRNNWPSKDDQFISHEFVSSMLADNNDDITPDVVAKVPSSRTNGSCWDTEPQP